MIAQAEKQKDVTKAKGAKQSMIAQAEKQKDVRACASFSELSQFELWRAPRAFPNSKHNVLIL